eukprot:COSAG05_NODE_145_length_16478_cov_15.287197_20_plen_75_part_00
MVVPEGVPPCGGADTHAEIGDGTEVTLPAAIDDFEPEPEQEPLDLKLVGYLMVSGVSCSNAKCVHRGCNKKKTL